MLAHPVVEDLDALANLANGMLAKRLWWWSAV
jgi:hypothetical protein